MKKENYDDIQTMFDSDGVRLPETLFKENMVGKIKENTGNPASSVRQLRPKRRIAAILSSAAVLALIVTAVAVSSRSGKPPVSQGETSPVTAAVPAQNNTTVTQAETQTATAPQEETDDSGLVTFQSEDEFIKFLKSKITDSQKTTVGAAEDVFNYEYASDEKNAAPIAPGSATNNAGTADGAISKGEAGSKTNTQVDGVDEADIIKNDGRYIYVITDDIRLSVIDTTEMKSVFTVNLEPINGGTLYTASEIYLTENRLIVLGTQFQKTEETENNETTGNDTFVSGDIAYGTGYCPPMYPSSRDETVIRIFDVSDKSSITQVTAFTQDGYYQNSRLVDGYVYIISGYRIFDTKDLKNNAVPTVNGEKISCDCLYAGENLNNYTYQTVVSGFSVNESNPTVSKVSVIGYADTVYCTSNTLYLLGRTWAGDSRNTEIFSFSLKDGKVEKKATGSVPGYTNNNYSVDEKDGYLRLATTDYNDRNGQDISSLYVLDEKLDIVGKLTDIAHDEQIKSARFIGNIAYIVTFRNTDPLFAIDLSDPRNPKILGKVKLPGFSEYLHPIGDNLLVGIGYDGSDRDADYQSLKITLFDISDPLNPTVKDSMAYKNTRSDVLDEPKSFIMGESGSDFYLPVIKEKEVYDLNGDWYKTLYTNRYLHLSAENGKLSVLASYTVPQVNDNYYYTQTGAYIGDNFYIVFGNMIYRFTISDGKFTKKALL